MSLLIYMKVRTETKGVVISTPWCNVGRDCGCAPGEGDDRRLRARRADREVHGRAGAEPAARGDRGLDGSRVSAAVPPLPLYVRL